MAEQFKISELELCCDKIPRYHSANGLRWVQCPECENRSQTYLTSGLSANRGWNEKRRKQIKVENLYNGKPAWYKATTVEE